MRFHPNSSAPNLYPASAWEQIAAPEPQARTLKEEQKMVGLVLHRSGDGAIEAGIQRWPVRAHSLEFAADRLFYFMRGRGTFRGGLGETIAAEPGMVVHLKSGWSGELAVVETLDASYMQCPGSAGAPLTLRDAINAAPLKDWGAIPAMIEGSSRTAGILLSRDADGRAESGLWTCTPGLWRCEVTRDEFCHFLEGCCTYTHDNGERIEIAPDTIAFFPAGWSGRCEVRQTVRKIYMIR